LNDRLGDGWRRTAARLEDHGPPPTWVLGLLAALLSWPVAFALPSPSLDVSWWAGLYMATEQGLQYGTEIVFSYGPLGFLRLPFLWFAGLGSVAFVYSAVVYAALAVALVWTLRRRVGAPVAVLLATLILIAVPSIEYTVALAALAAFGILGHNLPRHGLLLVCTLGAVFAAIEALVKLSSGPVIVLVLLIALIGARATCRQVILFLAIYVYSVLGLWLIAGQNLGNLPDFAKNSIEIVSGYNAAMATYTRSAWIAVAMAGVVLLALAWAWFGEYRDRRARLASVAIVAVIGGAMYKQGAVRVDAAHVAIFFAMLTLLWAAVPVPRTRLAVAGTLAGLGIFAAIAIHTIETPSRIDVIGNVQDAGRETETLVSSSKKSEAIAQRKSILRSIYKMKPEVLFAMLGKKVSVDPYEVAAAWAYDLDWSPLPVFQNYSAFTPELDRLNVEALESPDGPDVVLKENVAAIEPAFGSLGIDGRNPIWDPPGQAIATLCNFAPSVTTGLWQVLGRTPDRCGEPRPAGGLEAGFGQVIDVPAPGPGEVVYAEIEGAEAGGLEKLASLLYKPRARYAHTSDGMRYRLVAETAGDGLLLRAGRKVEGLTPPFTVIPQTETLELTGAGGEFEVEFFRMRVAPPPPAPTGRRAAQAEREAVQMLTGP
jgi:hypothetical protein